MQQTTEELIRSGGISTSIKSQDDDLLVVSASYEPRCTFVPCNLNKQYRVKASLLYVNREFINGDSGRPVRDNMYRALDRLGRHSDRVIVVEGSLFSAVDQMASLQKAFEGISLGGVGLRATLDCTTFSRESLFTTASMMRAAYGDISINVLYASAMDHGGWLSRGHRMLRNIVGFSGVHYPSRPTVVVVLSGFEPERTRKIIEEHEPSLVLLGVGDPPTDRSFLERNLADHKLVLSRQEVISFKFPAANILGCAKVLAGIVETYLSTHNIVLAPMSTKLSTLGALIVAERHPEIQVTYCVPGEYNVDEYSTGVRTLYSESLPILGSNIARPESTQS